MRNKGVKPQHQSQMNQQLTKMRADRMIDNVERAIADFIAAWCEKEPAFTQYFVSNYANRKEQWAVCYRDSSVPDTTAHAEAFHNLLKRVYSNKRNRYMADLIQKLMLIEEETFIKFQG